MDKTPSFGFLAPKSHHYQQFHSHNLNQKFIFVLSVLPFNLQFVREMFHKLSYLLLAHHLIESHATYQEYTYEVEIHERHYGDLKDMG